MTIHYSSSDLNACLQAKGEGQEEPKNLSIQEYIQMTTKLLEELIEAEGFDCQSMFNSQEEPPIRMEKYLQRLYKYTHFSPQCLILALLYLDRYNMAQPEFALNKLNVHRFFLTCLVVAVKYHDDIYFDNLTFEKVGGVTMAQLFAF